MQKDTRSPIWGWWMAGALAALAVAAPILRWSGQEARTHPGAETRDGNQPSNNNVSPWAATNIGSKNLHITEIEPPEPGRQEVDAPRGEASSPPIDAAAVFAALQSPNAAERREALEIAARFPDALYDYNAVYRCILALRSDLDKQVAKRARFARFRLKDLRARHEIPEPSEPEADDMGPSDDGTARPRDAMEKPVEPFEALRAKALDDPDPAVRMGGIESAVSQRDDQSFELLSQAVRGDYDPDNRMTAVSEVEQMLKSGLGDREHILKLLEESAADPDPRIAELSQVIIREQFGEDQGFAADDMTPR